MTLRVQVGLALLLTLPLTLAGCGSDAIEPSRESIRLATGRVTGANHKLGIALAPLLSVKVPGVQVTTQSTPGSAYNVDGIQQGTIDIGFAQADIAYLAHKRYSSTSERPRLRAIAVLYVNAVHIFTEPNSRIAQVSDFRGRGIAIGVLGGPTEVAARAIIESYGLEPDEVRFEAFDDLTVTGAAVQMKNRQLDAGIIVEGYPVPAISEMARTAGARLLTVEPSAINTIRSRYPFFRPVVIPSGTYRSQDGDVRTIGVDSLLVCREDLPEELVYELTKAFFDSLPNLAHQAAQLIDPEQGSATSIPLHTGAARFYRERELRR